MTSYRAGASLLVIGLLFVSPARADWYYYVMKVVCNQDQLRIINYSAYNEEGQARGSEPDAIDVDKLSTWRHTENDLNVPDKPLPYVKTCKIRGGRYRVVLTNAGGGYSAPYPVVNVSEISAPGKPRVLIRNLELKDVVRNRYEIIFSAKHPDGQIIDE
jgi:hypothetical protein